MAIARIRCTGCQTPVQLHCPDSNVTCTWLTCLNAACTVRYFDTDRGLVQHTDGTIVNWADMPTTSQPPTVTIEDETDGRTATPDP